MIRSFKDAATLDLFTKGKHRDFVNIAKPALKKLLLLESALALQELRQPPGNLLEALKGGRKHQHSIRINGAAPPCKED